jgi:hypothetical protein
MLESIHTLIFSLQNDPSWLPFLRILNIKLTDRRKECQSECSGFIGTIRVYFKDILVITLPLLNEVFYVVKLFVVVKLEQLDIYRSANEVLSFMFFSKKLNNYVV